MITSLVGFSLIWDSLDNRKNPTQGTYANFHQDVAGVGGQSQFVRETIDGRYYYPITDDFVGFLRLQGGQIDHIGDGLLPLIDNFNLGPTLVRGFAPGGIGPARHLRPEQHRSDFARRHDLYRRHGGIAVPDLRPAAGTRPQGRVVRRLRHLQRVQRPHQLQQLARLQLLSAGRSRAVDAAELPDASTTRSVIRTSIGGSMIWASPLGPMRFDVAYPIIKGKYDQTQFINFTGGATF